MKSLSFFARFAPALLSLAFLFTSAGVAAAATNTTVVVSPVIAVYGSTITLTATLQENPGSAHKIVGKKIFFTLSNIPVGSATTGAGGVATLSVPLTSLTKVGTHANYIGGIFLGTLGTYQGDSGQADLTVTQKPLTVINITADSKAYDTTTVATIHTNTAHLVDVLPLDNTTLVTTGATGTFSDANVGVGKTVQISGLGLSGSDASNYTLTQPTTTADINKINQTFTFGSLSDQILGTPDFTVSASTDSHNTGTTAYAASGSCSATGNTIHLFTLGTCTVSASNPGNQNYNAAGPINQHFNVTLQPVTSTSTVVVTQTDLDYTSQVPSVVAADGLNKWFMYNDNDSATYGVDNTLGSFVTGPSTPPAGTGSIEFTLGANPNDRKNIATYQFAGTLLNTISAMSYSAYSHSGVAGPAESPYLNFNIDFNGSNTWQHRIAYVPSINNASVPQDTWNTFDTINGGNALWNYSGTNWPAGAVSNGTIPGTTARTWSAILADYPNARVLQSDGWLGVRTGEPGPANYTADIDNITIATGSHATQFDFDPAPVAACVPGSTFDTFNLGSVNGQGGWSATGPYDQAIVNNIYGYPTFGCKALRISNAVVSGNFGDQTFSNSTANEAGESGAVSGGFSGGTRQNHFEAQFDLASALQTLQPGAMLSVSPDNGSGSRMSYLRFEDQSDGIHVFFDDVTDAGPLPTVATYNEKDIATITRAPHTIKFVMDFVDGPSNDIVKIYIDGNLVHTGTSWEDYYRYDPEQTVNGNKVPTVDSLLFRQGGKVSAASGTLGNGFLIDNLSLNTATVNGNLVISTYACPIGTSVLRSTNGVGLAVPAGCVPESGVHFGYVHGSQTDANGPYPELGQSFTALTTTDVNGVSTSSLPATGRYLVAETDVGGNQLPANAPLGLYCIGDGDQSNANDNQELTFVPPSGSVHCVAYDQAALPAPTPVSPADGTVTSTALQQLITWTSVGADDAYQPITYFYEASNDSLTNPDGSFTHALFAPIPTGTASQIATPGTPPGTYYWHVYAQDAHGNKSPWSATQKIVVDNTGTLAVKNVIVGGPAANGDFSFTVAEGGNAPGSAFAFAAGGENDFGVAADTYTVLETVIPSNYTATYSSDCTNGVVTAAATTTCTITNTYNAPIVPGVTTNPADALSDTGATLHGTNGSIDADNTSFWWGTTNPGSFSPSATPGSELPSGWSHDSGLGLASASAPFNEPVSSLIPGTTYYFAAWSLVGGTWYPGTILSFTTTGVSPTASVATDAANPVGITSATLNGQNGGLAADNTSFWWGTSNAGPFTSAVDPTSELPAGWSHDSGLSPAASGGFFNEPLSGLTANTQYFFAAWSHVGGTWYPGSVLNFTTSDVPVVPIPSVSTDAPSSQSMTDATLNGSVGPVDADAESFWVSDSAIDTSSPTIPANVYSTPVLPGVTAGSSFSDPLALVTSNGIITGGIAGNHAAITAGTTYHYVAWAHINGTWYHGADTTVTTVSAPVDTEAPVIHLVGTTPIYVPFNTAYTDQGVTVTDNIDHNLGFGSSIDGGATTTSPATITIAATTTEGTHTIVYSAQDSAGNKADPVTRTVIIDGTAPSATLTSTSTDPTTDNPIHVTVTFSEAVTGFDQGDLSPSSAGLSNFAASSTNPLVYTFDLTPTGSAVSVSIAEHKYADLAGNENQDQADFSRTYSPLLPPVTPAITSFSLPSGGGGGGGVIGGAFSFGFKSGGTGGIVLGTSTVAGDDVALPTGCSALLTQYMGLGRNNDPAQVKLLQSFLNGNLGAKLPVTGFFGPMTYSTVKQFQVKYKNVILDPWGITDPTGYVYKFTEYEINLLSCSTLNAPLPVAN